MLHLDDEETEAQPAAPGSSARREGTRREAQASVAVDVHDFQELRSRAHRWCPLMRLQGGLTPDSERSQPAVPGLCKVLITHRRWKGLTIHLGQGRPNSDCVIPLMHTHEHSRGGARCVHPARLAQVRVLCLAGWPCPLPHPSVPQVRKWRTRDTESPGSGSRQVWKPRGGLGVLASGPTSPLTHASEHGPDQFPLDSRCELPGWGTPLLPRLVAADVAGASCRNVRRCPRSRVGEARRPVLGPPAAPAHRPRPGRRCPQVSRAQTSKENQSFLSISFIQIFICLYGGRVFCVMKELQH